MCTRVCTGARVCGSVSVTAHAEMRRGSHANKASAPRRGKQQEGPADRAAFGPIPSKLGPAVAAPSRGLGRPRLCSSGCQGERPCRPCLHLSICLLQDPDFVRTLAEKRPDTGWVSTRSSRTHKLPTEIRLSKQPAVEGCLSSNTVREE